MYTKVDWDATVRFGHAVKATVEHKGPRDTRVGRGRKFKVGAYRLDPEQEERIRNCPFIEDDFR